MLRTLHGGSLRSIADVYVPFLLYRVRIMNASQQEERFLALDAVRGVLDLYSFPSIPCPDQLVEVETRNHIQPSLDLEAAQRIMVEKVRRIVFGAGFFKIRKLNIQPELVPCHFHVPYWVGFSGRGETARLAILDAVRGKLEGSKARGLFTDWLSFSPPNSAGTN